ncbi:alpha/beta hydrolase [Achromobacter sp. F4_2707]|uniref:alpha/beta fold hydrolase n=1 Tax=Achromobacter sp. F4_2707 TaxID=3114286 RepID=UPI0039C70EA1
MSEVPSPYVVEPRLNYVMCASPAGMHRMAYWEWGDPHNDKVLLCVHGLTRSGRDFDVLAARMAKEYRVVCPDVVGRGHSDWLINPSYYAIPQYVSDMLTLIARLKPGRLDWVGTSMGGLIGMGLAAGLATSAALRPAKPEPRLSNDQTLTLGRMVLNDIGPTINDSGLARISEYVGKEEIFDSFEQAVEYVKSVSQGFGPHDSAGWQALTRHIFNQEDGKWRKHYDLRIAEPIAQQDATVLKGAEAVLWAGFESLAEPVLVIRGETSDLLTEQGLQEMQKRNVLARGLTFPGVGHAPTLRSDDQVEAVAAFLLEEQAR